jgi:hypothetical protein
VVAAGNVERVVWGVIMGDVGVVHHGDALLHSLGVRGLA